MLLGESYVLEGVRDIIRIKCGLTASQCDCEPDEQIPAIADALYVAIIPGGISPGPNQNTSGGVHDVFHSVQIMAIHRKMEARDKQRSHFLNGLIGINNVLENVVRAIDWQADVLSKINSLMYIDYPTAQPFITPLRITRIDPKPRPIASDIYGGTRPGGQGTTPYIGVARSIYFGGMRRIQTVSQLGKADRV